MTAALPPDFGSLLAGAVDVHVHGQPDLAEALVNRGDDIESARLAAAYGIEGWVLKSHLWPTMDRARAIGRQLAGLPFTVYGSVTLNPLLGAPSAALVELAAAHGARVVFLPTWGARADVDRGGYIARLLERQSPSWAGFARAGATSLLDGNNRLTPATVDVVAACLDLGLSLATGHASLAESAELAEHCAGTSFDRLLVTHPLSYGPEAGQLRRFVELGAYVEFCAAPLLHPDGTLGIRDVLAGIEAVGVAHAVLSTDVFSRWVPPEPECLRMAAEQLRYLGCSPADLHRMLSGNPKRFLDWERDHPAPIAEAS